MAIQFMSDAWAQAYKQVLNDSAEYRAAAAKWEGDFYFVCQLAQDSELCAYIDLWHGDCRDAYAVNDPAAKQPEFVIKATLPVWQKILGGELDPIKGLMSRQLKLEGNMIKVLKAPKAAVEMVNCAMQIDTAWPA